MLKQIALVSKSDLHSSSSLLVLVCRYEREEAKITAWQNLQKAKSEAAVRKLEVAGIK